MTTLTITAKGQVTLRKELLRHLGVGPGDRIAFDPLPGGRVEVRAERHRTGRIEDLFGKYPPPQRGSLTIDDMNAIIAKGWAGELAGDD